MVVLEILSQATSRLKGKRLVLKILPSLLFLDIGACSGGRRRAMNHTEPA